MQPLCRFVLAALCATGLAFAAADQPNAQSAATDSSQPEWLQNLSRQTGLEYHGFAEFRLGTRLQGDDYEGPRTLDEARFQLALRRATPNYEATLRTDFLYDDVVRDHNIDLARGTGPLDLREANVKFQPFSGLDLKAGRQIFHGWGTGDLLFVNDLFPKDWQSLYSGRDESYLDAPCDALWLRGSASPRFSDQHPIMQDLFPKDIALDLVLMPRFQPDRYGTGDRLSSYNWTLARRAGEDAPLSADVPNDYFDEMALAARAAQKLGESEVAAYYYHGYWPSPAGTDPTTGDATFPRLSAYGASLRKPLLGGTGNLEGAYYDSPDDHRGTDPNIANSQFRALAGYQRPLDQDLTLGLQYYLEYMTEYTAFRLNRPAGSPLPDRARQVLGVRLTQLALQHDLALTCMVFYCPSNNDAYLRPSLNYRLPSQWELSAGANLFVGEDPWTPYNQYAEDSNVFLSVRRSF